VQHQKLLLEVGDQLHPLLKLGILCLDDVLKMHDRVGGDGYLLTCEVRDLQLEVLLRRLMCPTKKESVLTLKPLHRV
jgi:hypothetical protein